tara:strand:+ start:3304 stop:3969 length:666 start_codon:yes stop_codon:yes gene_type:complete
MIKVFIGYDSRMSEDFSVAINSLMEHSSVPISITPLNLRNLSGIYNRPLDPKASNEFSYTRFLVPYLCNYEGWGLFIDGDVVFNDDIWNLYTLRNDKCAVQVVKHDYTPKSTTKFQGNVQYNYPKKNWSSVMLFNNEKCKQIADIQANTSSGRFLHRFEWLESENMIGSLPRRWNFLVGEYEKVPISEISLLHYTEGTPLHLEYRDCDYAEEWLKYGRKYI